jgi:hypothetical protein
MVLVSMLLVSLAGVTYTRYVDAKREAAEREADRRWCTLLVLLDTNNQRNPPATETGRQYTRIIHGLSVSLGCESGDVDPVPGVTPTR